MSRASTFLLVLAAALGSAAPRAHAQSLQMEGYGVRAGASLDDDLTQFLFGAHADLGVQNESLRLRPLVTVGLGDDAVTLLAGGEVHYRFPTAADRPVRPYVGGGVALHRVDFDRERGGDDETDAALLVSGGIDVEVERWWGWFAEGRFVIADATIFRLEGGVNWVY